MARDFVLVLTLGTSDVQVVYKPKARPGGPMRLRLRRGHERAFHQACLDQAFPWDVVPLKDTPAIDRSGQELGYDPTRRSLSSGLTDDGAAVIEINCDDGVTLCCPIVADLIAALHEQQQASRLGKATHVLLLTTRRTEGPFTNQEPVAAAGILRPALAEALQIPEESVTERVFLQGREELYDEDKLGQQHLCVAAAKRIDDAITKLRQAYPKAQLLISDVGGIPEVKSVLAASARYRFGQRVRFIRPAETGGLRAVRKTIIPPAESLATRHQIRHLVCAGAFDAAARVAVSGGQEVADAEPWRKWLDGIARLLNADRSVVQEANEWPSKSMIQRAVRRIATGGRCLAIAFRVENALRSADWPSALRETFSFVDASRVERIRRSLSRQGKLCVDENGRSFYPGRVREDLIDRLPVEWRHETTVPIGGERGYRQNVLTRLVKEFGEDLLADVAELERLVSPLRDFRNREAHVGLQKGDLAKIRELAEGRSNDVRVLRGGLDNRHTEANAADPVERSPAALWSRKNPRFLGNSAVDAILNHLGVANPASLYEDLIAAIEHDMDAFSFRQDTPPS